MQADAAFVIALFTMAGLSFYFARHIRTARVPMQWGLDGQPTWFAPRTAGLWGPLVFALLVRLLMMAAEFYAPDKVHHAEIGLLLLSVILVVAHFGFLLAVRRWACRQA
jgi:hypothetical protein